ncbi:MAG: hypothetical protein [Bacteriophage sp.]|nr:MAG: hypothetical protein [Bacteriophage sp.]
MSLFSSFILPQLEKELLAAKPEIAQFILQQLKNVSLEVLDWAEKKLSVDLNGDGKIGGE